MGIAEDSLGERRHGNSYHKITFHTYHTPSFIIHHSLKKLYLCGRKNT